MSSKFNMIKKFYDDGNWNVEMVKNAVVKGKITIEEFKLITGEEYTF